MREMFKDKEHLVRVAVLAAGGFLVFLLVKALLVPADFGVYGHFRAGALDDNRARPLVFAGRQACADCHEDIVKARQGSKHAAIGCETCHGPLARHAADPSALKPERPDKRDLCLGCHQENAARPAGFPPGESRRTTATRALHRLPQGPPPGNGGAGGGRRPRRMPGPPPGRRPTRTRDLPPSPPRR